MTDKEAKEISVPSNQFLNVSLQILVGIAIIGGLYLSSLYSYILFHSIIEIFSIIVSACIFLIAWNSRRFLDSNYMLFLGISFLFIAIIDILHTLAYKGMGVFQGYDANLPTQLWIIMRYVLAISFLVAPVFIRRKVNVTLVLLLYSAATVLLLLFIFYWGIFPACYVEGTGLTPFKIYSEYIISLILLGSLIYLILERKAFTRTIFGLLIGSIVLNIAAEIAFTTYASVYGFSNMLGHMLVFVSFYLIYKALIETGLTKPYDFMFRDLKSSEKKNRIILEQMYDSYFEVDLAGNFTLVNESTCLNLGYSREELIGTSYRIAVPEGDIKPLLLAFNEVFMTGEANKGLEHKTLRKDGSILLVESSVSLRQNERGEVIGFRSISHDVTERKKAEEALREREVQYRELFNHMSSGVAVYEAVDNGGDFILRDFNPAAEKIAKISRKDILGKRVSEVFPGVKTFGIFEVFQRVWQTGKQEYFPENIYKDDRDPGSWRESWVFKLPGGEIVDVYNDVTRRKKIEVALRESEEQYRLLSEHTTDTIWLMDMNLKTTYQSPSAEKLRGYTPREILELPIEKHATPESLKLAFEVLSEEIPRVEADPGYNPVHTLNLEYYCKDGTTVWAETKFSVIRDPSGKPVSILAEARNITDRMKAEEALRESEEKYRSLFDRSLDCVYIHDFEGNFVDANQAALDLLGYQKEDIPTLNFAALLSEDQLPLAVESVEEIRRIGHRGKIDEYRLKRKDGEYVDIESMATAIKHGGKNIAVMGIARDVTERKRIEEERQKNRDQLNEMGSVAKVGGWELDVETRIQTWTEEVYNIHELIPDHQPTVEEGVSFYAPEAIPVITDAVQRAIQYGEPFDVELPIITAKGNNRWVHAIGKAYQTDGKTVKVGGMFQDITERKQLQQKLEEMATHDFLTGLPNRVLLIDRYTVAAALARRNKARLAVMSLDLDKFKTINDTLGHEAGDQVLKAVSTRLTGIIRASDTVARIGGDEFILIMSETKQREDTTAIAQKILDSFAEPLLIGGHQLNLSTSIGIAVYPKDGLDLETLTRKSDAAMYYSKGHGRNQFKFCSDGDVRIGGVD